MGLPWTVRAEGMGSRNELAVGVVPLRWPN